MRSNLGRALVPAAFSLAFAGYSVMAPTVSRGEAPAMVLGGCLLALAVGLVSGRPAQALRMPPVSLAASLAGGALVGSVAPAVTAANRFSDAPSGADVLFVTTAGWALATVLAGVLASRERSAVRVLPVAALAGAVGVAAVLANWERPSSFSPFFRWPSQELAMLLAGALWATGSLLLRPVLEREGWRAAFLPAAAGAAASSLAWALLAGALPRLASPEWVPFGVALAAAFIAWCLMLVSKTPAVAGLWLLPVPALISTLTFVEQVVGVFGPRPLLVGPVLAGSALTLAAALWGTFGAGETGDASSVVDVLAWLSMAAASAAMFMDALGVRVEAHAQGGTFNAAWSMDGWETVGGWAALAAALLLFSAARSRPSGSALAPFAALVLVFWLAGDTPLHTWDPRVPPAVQVDIGTEYARMLFGPWRPLLSAASMAVSGMGFALLLLGGGRSPGRGRDARTKDLEAS